MPCRSCHAFHRLRPPVRGAVYYATLPSPRPTDAAARLRAGVAATSYDMPVARYVGFGFIAMPPGEPLI